MDFGGGLERITAAVNNEPDIFKTDVFQPMIAHVEKVTGKEYSGVNQPPMRIIADHLKGAKSLRGKRPVVLVYCEKFNTQSEARKREAKIKNWKRINKIKLINRSKIRGLPCKYLAKSVL